MHQIGRTQSTFNLILSEDRLSSQYAQKPSTARRLINFIPSRAGDLKRKAYAPPFISTQDSHSGQDYWYSFAQDYLFYDAAGAPTWQCIVITSNNSGSFIWKRSASGTLTALPAGAHTPPHNPVSGWIGDPLLLYSDGRLYISDGSPGSNWTVYDGIGSWKRGFDVPSPCAVNVANSPGSIDIEIFREYCITEYDSVRKHESPPSTRVRYTPAAPGSFDITLDMPLAVTNTSTGWTKGGADKRRIYASAVDGSQTLFRIAEIPVTDTQYIDTNPFWGDADTTDVKPLEPPFRNHKPRPSLVGAKMNNRFAERDESLRSRIWITGYAEVREQDAGSSRPLETIPGARNEEIADINNLSDYDNSFELPDESFEVRAMEWWDEGLLLGTERSVMFLWGSKPEDFLPENTATYDFGVFHRNAFRKTNRGLVVFTADRKLLLDPALQPSGGNRTANVIDLGAAIQPDLDTVDIRFTNRFQMRSFTFGKEREWLVIAYTTQNVIDGGTGHLKVYDFEIGGWITFDDVAATCVGVVQEREGYEFLVAGNSVADRQLKVASDFDPAAASPYQAAATRIGMPATGTVAHPANTYRSALLDVGSPEFWHVWRTVSYFQRGSFVTTVKVWFDPEDIDDLDPGEAFTPTFKQLSTKEYRGWMMKHKKRAVFEFTIPADSGGAKPGSLEGIELAVEEKSSAGR